MNQKSKSSWTKHFDFMLLDIICIQAAYMGAYFYRHHNLAAFSESGLYTTLDAVLIVMDILFVLFQSSYKNILKRGHLKELKSVVTQNVFIWVVAMGYQYLVKQIIWFSRTVFVLGFIFSILLMLIVRIIWKSVVRNRLKNAKNLPYTLLITTRDKAEHIVKRFNQFGFVGFNLTGIAIIDDDLENEEIEGFSIVSNIATIREYLRTQIVDEVMVCVPGDDPEIHDLIKTMLSMGIVVHIGVDYLTDDMPNRYVEKMGGFTFMTTSVSSAQNTLMFAKRAFDIVAGLIGCIITGIMFIIIGPIIHFSSPGPVIYKQERIGKNGRPFKLYKFRSMYVDAEERLKELQKDNMMQGNMFKMENDPRIIGSEKGPGKGIGNFIRKWSIDEFPQFVNILKGDMSLVGTRPPLVSEFENYEMHHKIRLSMKPGLTGMWQVSGRNQITDFEKIVELDAYYIENWSIKLDIKIICLTFKALLSRKGAN